MATQTAIEHKPTLADIRKGLWEGTDQLFEQFFASIVEQAQMTPEQQTTLGEYLQGAIEKRDNLAEFLHRLEEEAEYLRKREKAIADRRHEFEKVVSLFKSSIQMKMECMGIRKVEGRESSFTITKNPPSVEIANQEQIPGEYLNYVASVDRTKVRADLEAGKEVPGAALVTNKTTLRIR